MPDLGLRRKIVISIVLRALRVRLDGNRADFLGAGYAGGQVFHLLHLQLQIFRLIVEQLCAIAVRQVNQCVARQVIGQ